MTIVDASACNAGVNVASFLFPGTVTDILPSTVPIMTTWAD